MKMLNDVFEYMLEDIYWVENVLFKVLFKVFKVVSSVELKKVMDDYFKEMKGYIKMFEVVFKLIGKEVKGEKCDVMDGFLKEVDGLIEDVSGYVLDVVLIGVVQVVEYYEIVCYGMLCEWVKVLGNEEVYMFLILIFDEEKVVNNKFIVFVVMVINVFGKVLKK